MNSYFIHCVLRLGDNAYTPYFQSTAPMAYDVCNCLEYWDLLINTIIMCAVQLEYYRNHILKSGGFCVAQYLQMRLLQNRWSNSR